MSFRLPLARRAIAPTAAALAAAGVALMPTTSILAEEPESSLSKKPIYDDFEPDNSESTTTPPTVVPSAPAPKKSSGPSPTDRLAVQIGKTRVFLHGQVAAAETAVNNTMTSALKLENSFTSTIAGLAPSPQSGERLMPGSIYVLVSAMTGSIIARNRNILLRATFPLAVGVGAGWVVLPVTMTNISELLWTYEKRFPAVAEAHIRTRESLQKAWATTKSHSRMAVERVDEKVGEGREAVEGWVRKGK